MDFQNIIYAAEGGVAVISLNRPEVRNAQSWKMLDEVDRAFELAGLDEGVRVVIVRGAGGDFSAGHDIGTPDREEERAAQKAGDAIYWYNSFRRYNLDLPLKWRAFSKPTIAMVEGYCIYAGWMLAAAMDVVFAADNAQFLAGLVEYMSIPWDVGLRRAKELCFESRFIGAIEAQQFGFVNRVIPAQDLERETLAYAGRVAENSLLHLRMSKVILNKAQDAQGFTTAVQDALGDFLAMLNLPGQDAMRLTEDGRRLSVVDLAIRGRRGERFGQRP